MPFYGSEPDRKRALLLRCQPLVAEEQHLVLEQCSADSVEQRARPDRVSDLNIVHERTERAGGFLDPHPTTALR